MDNLKDKIWLTSKSRVYSEERIRRYSITAHLLLTYMSVLMIVVSVFSDELRETVPYFEKIRISLSVLLLAGSLVILNARFPEKAEIFRKCYLELDELYRNFEKESDPAQKYAEILSLCPNHAGRDYKNMVVDKTLLEGKKLHSGDEEIRCTKAMIMMRFARHGSYWIAVSTLPAIITWLLFAPFIGKIAE